MTGKLLLCEYARITDNGLKFDIIGGGIKTVTIRQFPAPMMFTLLIETNFALAETGRAHSFEIKIIDEDGKPAGPPLAGQIHVNQGHNGPTYATVVIQFMVSKAQKITYSLLVNGNELDSTNLEIKAMGVAGKPHT